MYLTYEFNSKKGYAFVRKEEIRMLYRLEQFERAEIDNIDLTLFYCIWVSKY